MNLFMFRQPSNYDAIKMAHCNISPIAALLELVRENKWRPPMYYFKKLTPQFHKGSERKLFEVTCKVVHLQTKGINCIK